VSGVALIAIGSLVLTHNALSLLGVSPIRVGAQALSWFGAYWPLLLVAWGVFKVYQRVTHPERSHVTATEIVILAWILGSGLVIRGAERVMEEWAEELSPDDIAFVLGPDLLGPAHRVVEALSFDLDGASVLVVENRRGRVVIIGSDNPSLEVNMVKQVSSFSDAEAKSALAQVSLEFEPGDEARLHTSWERGGRAVVADLEIRAPREMSIRVINRRGAVRLEDVNGPATITTTHGKVEVSNLSSGIEVQTSHATIRLERISGSIVARNEHGAVSAIDIDGDVTVETEHSSITVENVSGDVSLETEHGAVRATDVTGGIAITSPYSEVSVERAGGSVIIASSHRPVFVHGVSGRLDLVSRYARVVVRGVAGDVSIENLHRPVSVADIQGSVSVAGEKCSVELDAVEGAITITSTHENIRVSELNASLDVRATDADVNVTAKRLADSVRVETTRGDVTIGLPADASAHVTASTRDGELRSEFPTLTRIDGTERRQRQWEGVLGSGTHPLTIVTTYGDIALMRR
jgi:DUF4097 and DUF4098 domain-containing protein YvlB